MTVQHMEALAMANERRLAQAEYRHKLAGLHRSDALHVLAEGFTAGFTVPVEAMYLGRVLCCVHGLNDGTADELLHTAGITSSRLEMRVERLTSRQRRALATELERMAS